MPIPWAEVSSSFISLYFMLFLCFYFYSKFIVTLCYFPLCFFNLIFNFWSFIFIFTFYWLLFLLLFYYFNEWQWKNKIPSTRYSEKVYRKEIWRDLVVVIVVSCMGCADFACKCIGRVHFEPSWIFLLRHFTLRTSPFNCSPRLRTLASNSSCCGVGLKVVCLFGQIDLLQTLFFVLFWFGRAFGA
jgi:hypothetical protein